MLVLDRRWYLDVNRLARDTAWAHGLMTSYTERVVAPIGAGLLVLAVLVVVGWWSARREPEHMAAVVWAAVGALVALGVNQVLVEVLARPRPYQVIKHVEVLVPRASGYAFPNGHAAIAGAVVCGLVLARRRRAAFLALLACLLLLFAAVYVGADYPSDVAAGAAIGGAVEVALWPLGSWLLAPLVATVSESVLGRLIARRGRPKASARQPTALRPTNRVPRSSTTMPNARAMDALRAASEAAGKANHNMSPAPASSIRTSSVRPVGRRDQGDREAPHS